MRVLFTKEFDTKSYQLAHLQGIELIYVPFISTKLHEISDASISWFSEHTFDVWIFTSAVAASYALKLIETHRVTLPEIIYAIGEKTAAPLMNLGIEIRYSRQSSAESLAHRIREEHLYARCCYFNGNISLKTIETILRSSGISVNVHECYKTEIRKLTIKPDQYDSVFFFSPSAVDAYVQSGLLHTTKKYFAIGRTTASAVSKYTGVEATTPRGTGFDEILKCLKSNSFRAAD